LSIDKKSSTDPPQAGYKIAKAKPPADQSSREKAPDRAFFLIGYCTVNQPDQHWECDKTGDKNIKRRLGECRNRTTEKSDQRPAPAA